MIVSLTAADLGQLAALALAEAERHPPRTPGRRAAGHLLYALTEPRARTVASARSAIASFSDPATQRAATELLGRLAGQLTTVTGEPR